MKTRLHVLMVALAAIAFTSCTELKAKAAFKEGNKLYKDEKFKQAILQYEEAVALAPEMVEAHFYLASAHQAMYRPGKPSPENDAHLEKAVAGYQKSLELNPSPQGEPLKQVRANALGALTGIFSEDPYKNFDEASKYAQQLVQDDPSNAKNLFAMAGLYEKFDKVDDAEKMYREAATRNPQDVKACGALAAFLNKPLWEGKSKFDEAVGTLQQCAELAPNEAGGYYKVATFYWDKAYRDPMLNDKQKDEYADKGLAQVDKALSLKPDYVDAIIYKGLLFRVKAQVTTNPRLRMQFLEQAQALQKQALELKKAAAASGTGQ